MKPARVLQRTAEKESPVNDRALSVQLRRIAFEFGVADAEAEAAWQHSLEEKLWGKVLPDFTLEQKAVVLTEYGRGWRSAGRPLPAGHPVPEQGASLR
jgi:hypothetical protein